MEKERRRMVKHLTDIMWYMRGSITRNDAWTLSFHERQAILNLIEERVKAVEKTGLPII